MQADLLNPSYIAGCTPDGDSTNAPDCGHPDCGILCDVAMVANRHDGPVAELVSAFRNKPLHGRSANGDCVQPLLKMGYSLVETARLLGVPVDVVVAACTDNRFTSKYLAAEVLLHLGQDSFQAVGEMVGLTREQVRWFAGILGIESPISQRRAAGGTDKYSAATVNRIHKLRGQELSWRLVSESVNVPAATCRWIYLHKAPTA